MKKLLNIFFPWLELKENNLKTSKRLFIYAESILAIVMIMWTLWIFFGLKLIFSHIYKYDNSTIYTTYTLNLKEEKNLNHIILDIEKKFKKHNLNFQDLKADIFLEKGDFFFKLSLVPGTQLLPSGSAVTFGKNIFIPNVNLEQNTSMLQSGKKEYLMKLLNHELVHVWQNTKYAKWFLPVTTQSLWIVEGYACYVTDSKFLQNTDMINRIIQKPKQYNRYAKESYVLWGNMIKHAIEDLNKSVDDLHLGNVDYDEVYDSLLRKYDIVMPEHQ